MNKVVLMGRLTRDPNVRYSQGDRPMAVARYTLAVDRRFRREGEPDADFISCVAFGRQGEFAEKYLKQGTKIAITGRIQTGSYIGKDGNRVYTTDVIVEEQEFAESKASQNQYQASNQGNNFGGAGNYNGGGNFGGFEPAGKPAPSAAAGDGFMSIPDGIEEELPFS